MIRVERGISREYEDLFRSDPGATAFHHPDFLRAYEAIFGGRFEVWWLDDDCACPFVINEKGPYRSASSAGYGCYGGPIGNPERFSEFLRLARARGFSRLEVVDFRNRLPVDGFRVAERTAHIIELPENPDEVTRLYSNSRRRNLRKALRVERSADPSEFYELHSETFRSLRTWVTPEEGITALFGSEIARFYSAYKERELAGVLLVLSWGQEAMWWISGRKPWGEGVMTHLLHAAILDAIAEGRRSFNLGGTDAPGPARFKESMGARPYSYRSLVSERGVFGLLRRIRRNP
ncbi:MAG: GNAT family N-acetyltransferase [candidate division WOR-3 bacterium]